MDEDIDEDELDTRRPWERVGDFKFEDDSGEATGTSFQELLNFSEHDDFLEGGDFSLGTLDYLSGGGEDPAPASDLARPTWPTLANRAPLDDSDIAEELDSSMRALSESFDENNDFRVQPADNQSAPDAASPSTPASDTAEATSKAHAAEDSPAPSVSTAPRTTALTYLEARDASATSTVTTSLMTSEDGKPSKARAPSIFITVFSRRDAAAQRALVRDMWIRAVASSEGNATMRFTVCQGDDEHSSGLDLEHAVHGDLMVLDCEEGYGHGLLTRKVISAMMVFRKNFPGVDLFMKIDDDSFVSWHKLTALLIDRAHENAYVGVPIGRSVPCRNSSFRWYEPYETYPYEFFPKAMAGGPGYTLGRRLVERILDTGVADQNLLWNEDRAVGVWINRLRKAHGTPVEYIALNGVDGWWGWNWKKPQESWKVWGDYPHTVHHGLRGDTIACLALAAVRNKPDRRIDTCFAFEVGQEHTALKCAMQTTGSQKPSLLQMPRSRRSGTARRLRRTTRNILARQQVSSGSFAAERGSESTDGAAASALPRGSAPDWKTKRQRLTFVHIPKNGGTAIEQAGQAGGVWWPRKWLSFWHGIHMPDGSWCEKYHVPPQYLLSLGDPDAPVFDDPGTFCVVRHPFERAVSEYKYMLSVKWGRSMSEMYGTGLYDHPKCTAEGLNHFLQRALTNFLKGKRFLHDCHMVPQTEFIWGKDGKQWCRKILRSENLVPSFNALMADHRYGVRLRDEKINNSTDACHGVSVEHLYHKTKRMLETVYESDLKRLNYSSGMVPLQFLHIPRNAGTEISEMAAREHVPWGRRIVPFQKRAQLPDSNWCEKHHVPLQHMDLEQVRPYEGAETFCVSRHPYDRAVSAYKAISTMKDFETLMKADGLGSLLHVKQCTVPNMNAFLQAAANLLQSGQSYALDCQMAPQTAYTLNADGTDACHVTLRYKELPEAFNHLMVARGFPQVQLNASGFHLHGTSRVCPDVTSEDLAPETRKVLDTLYEADFQKLDYLMW